MKSSRFSTLCSVAKSYRIAENVRSEIYTKMKITSITISSTAPVHWIQMCFIFRTWCLALKQIHNETQETMPPHRRKKKMSQATQSMSECSVGEEQIQIQFILMAIANFKSWTLNMRTISMNLFWIFLVISHQRQIFQKIKFNYFKISFSIFDKYVGNRVTRRVFSVV